MPRTRIRTPWCFQCRRKRSKVIAGLDPVFCCQKCAAEYGVKALYESSGHYFCDHHDIWYEGRCHQCDATLCENR